MNSQLRETIITSTKIAIDYFTALPGNPKPEKRGGILTYYTAEKGIEIITQVGEIADTASAERYFSFSREKMLRLKARPEHLSSFQSRNPKLKWWGGAIRIGNDILSFSGLPELGDEAVMLVLAMDEGRLAYNDAARITAFSSNQLFEPLYEKFFI